MLPAQNDRQTSFRVPFEPMSHHMMDRPSHRDFMREIARIQKFDKDGQPINSGSQRDVVTAALKREGLLSPPVFGSRLDSSLVSDQPKAASPLEGLIMPPAVVLNNN